MAMLDKVATAHPDKITLLGDRPTAQNWFTYHFGTNHTWQKLSQLNGKVVHYTSHPAFEDAIKFMNELARKGYYPKEALVWGKEVEQNIVGGNVAVWMGNGCGYDNINDKGQDLGNTGTTQKLLPTWNTYAYTLYIVPWIMDLFPKSSKLSDRAIRFVEYAATPEGMADLQRGVEGEKFGDIENGPHYAFRPDVYKNDFFPQGIPMNFIEVKALYIEAATREQMDIGSAWFYAIDGAMPGNYDWPGPNENDKMLLQQNKPGFTASPEMYIPIRGDSDEGIIRGKIDTLFNDYFARMVFAETADQCLAELANFKADAKKIGIDKLERLATEIYQANMKKAGKM
jgi:ABC-type glycerol-3-phosphate transport system substrate-binding protein